MNDVNVQCDVSIQTNDVQRR